MMPRRETAARPGPTRRHKLLVRAAWTGFAVVFLAAAFYGARNAFSGLRPADVADALRAIPPERLALALLLALMHYAVLGGYDATSARTVGVEVEPRRSALASSVGHAFSHALGFGAVTGSGARIRLYKRWGVRAQDVARIVLANALTYTVGVVALGAVLFTWEPFVVPPEVAFLPSSLRPLGAACAVLFAGYVTLVLSGRRPPRLRGYEIPIVDRGHLAAQLLVPVLAWTSNAAIAYSLLPGGAELGFAAFLEIFLLAQVVGLISHVPGGIGVVESVVVASLGASVPAARLVAAFLVYRIAFNLLPFVAALTIVGVVEYRRRREKRSDPEVG